MSKAEVFKANLRGLLESRGLSQKDGADAIGVPYGWLRKACSGGLSRVVRQDDGANAHHLERICQYFGILDVKRLWSDRLKIDGRKQKPDLPEIDSFEGQYVSRLMFLLYEKDPALETTLERKGILELIDAAYEKQFAATRNYLAAKAGEYVPALADPRAIPTSDHTKARKKNRLAAEKIRTESE